VQRKTATLTRLQLWSTPPPQQAGYGLSLVALLVLVPGGSSFGIVYRSYLPVGHRISNGRATAFACLIAHMRHFSCVLDGEMHVGQGLVEWVVESQRCCREFTQIRERLCLPAVYAYPRHQTLQKRGIGGPNTGSLSSPSHAPKITPSPHPHNLTTRQDRARTRASERGYSWHQHRPRSTAVSPNVQVLG